MSLAIQRNETKTTETYQYVPVRTTKIKMTIPNIDKDTEKLDPFCIASGNVK